MAKRMLIDAAHPEETRVVVLSGHRLEEFDFETSTKKQIKGNIYLAKVTRVEPSLQAAFVEYGGNRHGFLAFNEIHPDYYRIPIGDRRALEARDARARELVEDARHADSVEVEGVEVEEEEEEEEEVPQEPSAESSEDQGNGAEPGAAAMPAEATGADILYADHETEKTGTDEAEHDTAESPEMTSRLGNDEAGGTGDYDASSESVAPSAAAEPAHGREDEGQDSGGEPHAASTVIETVGGDELEEAPRQRVRSFRHYKIQEVVKRRQIMLVQVTKEERGNKGAALTTFISLAGRYCVLMPNTPRGGGVSRKITSITDRRRLKDLMSDLDVPDGMGVIVRTAGSERSKTEIKRDFEYLMRLWDDIRDLTLKSTAPALIYEEGSLIKRAIRDLYARDIDEVIIDGEEGYRTAKAFMKMLMPSHAKRIKPYRDPSVPLFHRFQVETQIDAIHSPIVQLRSGGYIVINPTEALVAIDVNSGRSTRERNIEETALKTNVEAAEEIARQLRLRDLAGLIVIDFIDMEEHRNQATVERKLKDAMRHDRARIQLGRISPFGLLEMSRQRLRPSLLEASTQPCPHCNGSGHIRSTESTALHVLRAIEEEGMRRRSAEITVTVPTAVALYILNHKRQTLVQAEARNGFRVTIGSDDTLIPPAFRLERLRALTPAEIAALPAPVAAAIEAEEDEDEDEHFADEVADEAEAPPVANAETAERTAPAEGQGRRRRRRRGRRGDEEGDRADRAPPPAARRDVAAPPVEPPASDTASGAPDAHAADDDDHQAAQAEAGGDASGNARKRRRRGRRGGRRRRREPGDESDAPQADQIDQNGEPPATTIPIAETVEYVPAEPEPSRDDAAAAMSEAWQAPAGSTVGDLGAESVPIGEHGDRPSEPASEPEPKEPAHADTGETVGDDAMTSSPTQPAANPRRGWWRRRGS